jgi:alpha-galactosidase
MWRVSDDFWDTWPSLLEQFERLHKWTEFRGPGHFPDADMLPLGRIDMGRRATRFTKDEQYTLLTLWAVARSPLVFGGDMTKMDDFTLSLLTDEEVLAVDQESGGNRQLFRVGGRVAWVADVPRSRDKYLAVFNTNDGPRTPADGPRSLRVPVRLSDLGFRGACRVRDLWRKEWLGEFKGEFAPEINWHGAGLYRVSGTE